MSACNYCGGAPFAMIGDVPCPQCDGTGHGAYNDPEPTYKIVRHHFNADRIVIKTGLTLEEAQEHCHREDTHGDGWFDGYTEE